MLEQQLASQIRTMQMRDKNEVVSVHLASFQGFFLTFLGRQFLSELYAAIVDDATGVAFVCSEGARVLGFVAGTSQPAGFYSRLLQRRWWRFHHDDNRLSWMRAARQSRADVPNAPSTPRRVH